MSSFHYSQVEFYQRLSMGMTIDRCYELENARFFSFSKCPPNFLPNFSYIKLAAAGFYFDCGQCKCFKCGIIWTDNHSNRDLMEVHRQISPSCHFACSGIMEIRSANVNCPSIGIRRSPNVEIQDEPRSEETRMKGTPGTSFRSSGLLDTGYSSLALSTPIQEEGQPSNIQSSQQCSNAEESHNDFIYSDYNARLSSFGNWPKTQTPVELASAGFFYTGTNDVVKCFSCRVRLGQWEPHENPWMEHKKHSPDCKFVETKMPLLHKQPSPVPKKVGGAVAYPDEVHIDLDIDLTNTSGSTNIISRGNTHPYLVSTATRAVLETATGPNTKKHVEKILDALCSEYDIHVEPKNEPNAVQIYGVLLIMEEYEEELKKRDKEIEKRDMEIEKLERKQLALNYELEDLKSRNTQICGICCTEVRNMVFFPCGHVYCCEQCAMRLQQNSPQNQRAACPTCRRQIERSAKIYWS
ncbi:unnamed protein product [Mytilus coruscus]|uniref:RING-type domain-containing protein n=1 Tax=Mytilus coruscus TaxID=42192 RepID=A0A6J8E6M1_MYTCO|nr:unnamed protein product [Mytilus coruscus]